MRSPLSASPHIPIFRFRFRLSQHAICISHLFPVLSTDLQKARLCKQKPLADLLNKFGVREACTHQSQCLQKYSSFHRPPASYPAEETGQPPRCLPKAHSSFDGRFFPRKSSIFLPAGSADTWAASIYPPAVSLIATAHVRGCRDKAVDYNRNTEDGSTKKYSCQSCQIETADLR